MSIKGGVSGAVGGSAKVGGSVGGSVGGPAKAHRPAYHYRPRRPAGVWRTGRVANVVEKGRRNLLRVATTRLNEDTWKESTEHRE